MIVEIPMTSKSGKPDIKIGRLDIWVHGRQFPEAQDYWDSNALSVTAEYTGLDSRVMAHGSFIDLRELDKFYTSLQVLNAALNGTAVLDCRDPCIHVEIRAKSLGHLEIKTSLTADHMTESHIFTERSDQTFLPAILSALSDVLTRYPVHHPGKTAR